MPVQLTALLAAAALVAGGLVGRDDEPAAASPPSGEVSYCELSAGLERAGREAFQELEQDPNATRQDFERTEAAFLRDYEDQIEALVAAAPVEIAAEVGLLIDSIRARADSAREPLDPQAIRAAEETVRDWESANCAAPSPPSD